MAGFSLLEVIVVFAIATVATVISIPVINTSLTSMHLGSSTASLSNGLQGIRYQAIAYGCPIQVTISSQSYQLAAPAIVSNICNTAYPYPTVVSAYPYNTSTGNSVYTFASSDVTVTSVSTTATINGTATSVTLPVTIQFNADGTVRTAYAPGTSPAPAPTNFSIVLQPNSGAAKKTIALSGVGYVTVH